MVKIRLAKHGRKNAPSYRIVAADSRAKRDGKYLELLGFFNPMENSRELNMDRYKYWISVGAQPTGAVESIIGGKYDWKPYSGKPVEDVKVEETKE